MFAAVSAAEQVSDMQQRTRGDSANRSVTCSSEPSTRGDSADRSVKTLQRSGPAQCLPQTMPHTACSAGHHNFELALLSIMQRSVADSQGYAPGWYGRCNEADTAARYPSSLARHRDQSTTTCSAKSRTTLTPQHHGLPGSLTSSRWREGGRVNGPGGADVAAALAAIESQTDRQTDATPMETSKRRVGLRRTSSRAGCMQDMLASKAQQQEQQEQQQAAGARARDMQALRKPLTEASWRSRESSVEAGQMARPRLVTRRSSASGKPARRTGARAFGHSSPSTRHVCGCS